LLLLSVTRGGAFLSSPNEHYRILSIMATQRFLAVGDLLINPDLLAYATFDEDADGPRLRLGFATGSGGFANPEVQLSGSEAGVALRWLRLHATSLTQDGAFGSIGRAMKGSLSRPETEARVVDRGILAFANQG
jgi:hypothetical protein